MGLTVVYSTYVINTVNKSSQIKHPIVGVKIAKACTCTSDTDTVPNPGPNLVFLVRFHLPAIKLLSHLPAIL